MKLTYNDSSHSYWLDGKRVKSASKVAGIAADSYTIEQWQKRQVAIGMTLDRTLSERVAVDLENREAIQQVCDDASNAAKANARAQRGTQRHRVFELLLLDQRNQFITDQQRADAAVLDRTLERYQLEPIPDRVEQFIAWSDNGVVGRYDAYLQHQGRAVLVDLKGGQNAVKYPHSTAVQLWLYRFAPHTSKTISRNGDKSEVTEWTTAPDNADEDVAYVIYCDDHHDVGELWRIDLNAARSGGELALGIVDWRKSYDYGRAIATQIDAPGTPDNTEALLTESTLVLAKRSAPKNSSAEQGDGYTSVLPGDAPGGSAEEPFAWRLEAKHRYDLLSDEQRAQYTALKAPINTSDRAQVFALLDRVEVFAHPVDTPPPPPKLVAVNPPPAAPDEGGTVNQADIDMLRQRFDALPVDMQMWIGILVAQATNAGVDWRTNVTPTVRRYELGRAIIRLAENGSDWANDEVIHDMVNPYDDRHPDELVGVRLGLLDAEHAAEFAQEVDAYLSTRVVEQPKQKAETQ